MSREGSSCHLAVGVARPGERGFTLLEILVALVVLAIGLGAVSTGVALALRSDARAHGSQAALHLAQSRLEAAGIAEPLVPGQRQGQVGNKYRWRQTVTEVRPSAEPAPPGAMPRRPAGGLRTFWVSVVVETADGITMNLAALKLAAEAKP